MSNVPSDRKYLPSHEWHKAEGDLVVIGLSEIAIEELTDVTFVDIRVTEGSIAANESFGDVESVKATSEMFCGIEGEVVEVNQAVIDDPSLLNQDAYGNWLIKVKPATTGAEDALLSAEDYQAQAGH